MVIPQGFTEFSYFLPSKQVSLNKGFNFSLRVHPCTICRLLCPLNLSSSQEDFI